MKALVFHAVGDIRLDDVPDPQPQEPTDAIVRLTSSAICGADLHFVRGTMDGMKEGTILESAYKAFDRREAGWIKVELAPQVEPAAAR
jgi:threonine dehydrogenase-like Zn-dependent dehydrogenase